MESGKWEGLKVGEWDVLSVDVLSTDGHNPFHQLFSRVKSTRKHGEDYLFQVI